MKRLNLGCGKGPLDGWINLDVVRLPGVDVVADLERCAEAPLPFALLIVSAPPAVAAVVDAATEIVCAASLTNERDPPSRPEKV